MNAEHLGERAVTVYEALEDAGFTTAAVNMTCYRGRTRAPAARARASAAWPSGRSGSSTTACSSRTATGAPIAVRNRAESSVDAYAAAVGRWLVTRDGFDFLVYYLPDYDFASHAPARTRPTRRCAAATTRSSRCSRPRAAWTSSSSATPCSARRPRTDACRAGGAAPGRLRRLPALQPPRADAELAVTASNRAGMVYALPRLRGRAARAGGPARRRRACRVVLFLEGGEAVARREGEELRFAPAGGGWTTSGDEALAADYPDAYARGWAALTTRTPASCSSRQRRVSSSPTSAGRHHVGGGSHGSLSAGDSIVPCSRSGIDAEIASIVDVAPAVARAFRRRGARVRSVQPDERRRRMVDRQLRRRGRRGRARARRRWSACRASSSCPRACATGPTTTRRCRSAAARRCRSRTWSRKMCELLSLDGDERVLDVGTGSGYHAAVLAELARRGGDDRARARARRAGARRASTPPGTTSVEVRVGDGTLGVPERAPFDAIAVAAAAPHLPESLYEQLRARRSPRRAGRRPREPAPRADRPQPRRAGRRPLGAVPLRAAVGEEGFSE